MYIQTDREIDRMVEDQTNEYLSTDWDSVMDWTNDFDYFGGMDELSENDLALIKLDNLKNKLFNEFADLCVMLHEDKKMTYRQTDKYLRLYEYFRKFSDEQKSDWIQFPVDR
jgi:hypothetical protein